MKALVTGGGGFIGSALVHELVRRGISVTSFSRGDYPELRNVGVNLKRGDLTDIDAVLDACDGMDIVFHVAAKAGIWGSYKDYYSANVLGTENIVRACREKKTKWLIYTSSASVVFSGIDIEGSDESLPYPPRPLSHYSATKALAEKHILNADSAHLKTIALRPHIVLGQGDNHLVPRIISQAKAGKLRRIGNGKNRIDISSIENVVAAHLCAAEAIKTNPEASGKAYFISNGEPVYLWDHINLILKDAGIKPVTKSVPENVAYTFSALTELFYKIPMIKKEPRLTRFLVLELSRSHWFDISAARKMLDYNPEN
jgi:nucleoside-diphosphate-sugar epimerase